MNSPFTTWPANNTEGTPGILKLHKSITAIEYFFCEDDIKKNIKKIGNIDVIFTIKKNGTELYAQKKAADTSELVATINNSGTTDPNIIDYNKDSDLAKELLNTGAMYTYIGAKGLVCDGAKSVTITFAGKDHFQANFIRPVEISTNAADDFRDGIDFGEDYSYVTLESLIDPYDYRDRKFSQYTNYWDYYGPFKITVDTGSAMCDLNGVKQALPATVILKQYDKGESEVAEFEKSTSYGYLTYKNNGTKLQNSFHIYVKVKVDYGWGIIYSDEIEVNVKTLEAE